MERRDRYSKRTQQSKHSISHATAPQVAKHHTRPRPAPHRTHRDLRAAFICCNADAPPSSRTRRHRRDRALPRSNPACRLSWATTASPMASSATPKPTMRWDSAICAEADVVRPARRPKKKVIAYAISVTGDSPGWNGIDGAAVLGHSAVRAHRNSSYDAALVAFVSPSVSRSRDDISSRRSGFGL